MSEYVTKANNSQEQADGRAKEIAIIGAGLRFPKADTLEEFWENLMEEKSLISEIPPERWDKDLYRGHPNREANKTSSIWGGFIDHADCFDASFFNISPREASFMDPQQRIALELAWKAIEDAGYRTADLKEIKTGVFMGVCNSDYTELIEKCVPEVDPYMATGTANAILANRISHWFDFKGPSLTIDAACASSLAAIHQAVQAIKNEECEYALAGGVNLCWSPRRFIALSQSGMLAGDGKCKTFDEKADGYVRGEGGAIIVLKPLDRAVADHDHIYAVLKGTGTNHGGRTGSLTVANPGAQAELIVEVYEKAGVGPDTVSYIEVHGVGSALGDSMEIYGLKTAFNQLYNKWNKEPKQASCGIGSVKTNIGHLEAAAGMAGVLKIIASLRSKILPASINLTKLNSLIKIAGSPFYIVGKSSPWEAGSHDSGCSLPRRAGVSAIGWGGSNAHVILEEYIPRPRPAQDLRNDGDRPFLIPLSAKNFDRLKEYAASLLEFLKKAESGRLSGRSEKIGLPELACTLQTGREALEERVIFLTSGIRHLMGRLEDFILGGEEKDWWRGRVSRNTGSEEEQGAQIKHWIEQNNAEKIAWSWVNGSPIDWGLFYCKGRPLRLSLPTYPLARERCWMPGKETGTTSKNEAPATFGVIHPLLQQNTSDFYQQRFSSIFTGEEFFLAGHVVRGRRVLPGVAALEMARAAVWQAVGGIDGGREAIRLKDVVWVRPVTVEEKPVSVHIGLSLNESGEITFEIYDRRDPSGEESVVYCQGGAEIIAAAAEDDLEPKNILERCTRGSLSSARCYEAYREAGIEYGPGQQGIENVYLGECQALARLALPVSVADTLDQYVLHPGLLDSAWQASLLLITGQDILKPALPFALQEALVLKKCAPRMWAFIRFGSGSRAGDRVEKLDIDLCDDQGVICVKMRGLSFREPAGEFKGGARPSLLTAAAASDTAGEADDSLPGKVRAALQQAVAGLLQVRIEDIDGHTDLGEYGFGSITYTELANKLNRQYLLPINPTLFFEYTTLDGLAGYLVKEHRDLLAPQLAVQSHGMAAGQPAAEQPTGSLSGTGRRPRLAGYIMPVAAGLVSQQEPVAIVGLSGIFPGAGDVREFWKNLLEGRDCITEIPKDRWDWEEYYGDQQKEDNKTNIKWGGFIDGVDQFDPLFFGISPKEAELMDPQQRLLLTCAWKAIEDAGYAAHSLSGTNTGIFVGLLGSGYSGLLARGKVAVEGYSFTGMLSSMGPNRLSYLLNLHGPSEPVETACSSSLVAIHRAVNAIAGGSCEMALAGGVNTILTPDFHISFSKAGMLSPDGRCKTFSDQANGYVRGEGAGMLLLKKLSTAQRDGDHIYGVIRGTAENHGGRANSLTAPNPRAQAELLIEAYTRAGIDPGTVTCLEAHGTGTELGDPIEINGLQEAFKKLRETYGNARSDTEYCGLGSVKTNIGHLELAAGIAGVIKVLLQLKHKTLVKSLHCETINPYIRLEGSPFYIVRENRPWKALQDSRGKDIPRRAGVSSFGFGGVNAHVIIEEYLPGGEDRSRQAVSLAGPFIIPVSARREDRLLEQVRQLLAVLVEDQIGDDRLADLAYTLQVGREPMEERLAVLAGTVGELKEKLGGFAAGREGIEGMYRGRVKQNREALSVFAGDEELQEAVGKWIERGKYKKLLELWVKGLQVDWHKLYGRSRPRRMSLPAYPFARERYWVPAGKSTGSGAAGGGTACLHPLLQQNTSSLIKQRFSSTFDGQEFFLADHMVLGKKVLPGVAHLEMARAAVERSTEAMSGGKTAIRLKNVVWSRPVVVGDQPVKVHIGIIPVEGTEIEYEIYGETEDLNEGPAVYSRGRAWIGPAGEEAVIDIKEWQSRCSQDRLMSDTFYQLFGATGINLGPSLRGVVEIYTGPGQVLARLSLPGAVSGAGAEYVLHPGLLDAALQATTSLAGISAGGDKRPSIPFTLEEIEILGGCTPQMWALARHSGEGMQKTDIDICDSQGKVCVRIKGLTTRVLEGHPEEAAAGDSGILLARPGWRELPAAGSKPLADYTQHLVLLCDPSENTLAGISAQMSGARCLALESGEKSPEERFLAYAARTFEEIQKIMRDRTRGRVLVQVTAPGRGEKELYAGLTGLLRTARLENPRLIGQFIETGEEAAGRIAELLLENCQCPQDSHIRYRDGRRWVRGLMEMEDTGEMVPWKDRGIYLITGGAGGLGLILAGEIAQKARGATVVLSGRSPLGKELPPGLKELQARGAGIEYRQADVTCKEQVHGLIQGLRQEYGGINGIIHCAGIVRDNFIIKKAAAEFLEVLGPKVTGLANLDEASRELPLDFFLLFSSITGSLGNVGQSDYSAANAFMDAYAGYRRSLEAAGQRRGRTLSLGWPLWMEGGMRLSAENEKLVRQNTGLTAMSTAAGLRALYRGLASGRDQVLVMSGRPEQLRQKLLSNNVPPLGPDNYTAAEVAGSLAQKVQSLLVREISGLLKVKTAIDTGAELGKYGFDSLTSAQLANRLNTRYRLQLSPAVFFEYPTIEGLAGYLASEQREALARQLAVKSPSVAAEQPAADRSAERLSGRIRPPRFINPALSAPGSTADRSPEPIAIVGMSGTFPKAGDVREFWKNLQEGRDCITEIPKDRWDWQEYYGDPLKEAGKTKIRWGGFIDGVDRFDPLFFGISPKEARLMDPQQRLLLTCVWNTLEDAGITPGMLAKKPTGVFIAAGPGEYRNIVDKPTDNIHVMTSIVPSLIPNRISHALNLRGPSEYFETACSSALVALHRSIQSIRGGECEQAIVGAVNLLLTPAGFTGFEAMGYLSTEGKCKSFQAGANGYVRSEGVGAIVIRPLSRAIENGDHIYALIKGTGVGHGGRGMSLTAPNMAGMKAAMVQAYQSAGIDPRTVSYIEAHGIASPLGDSIEIDALKSAYRELAGLHEPDFSPAPCYISSIKPCIGHGEVVSGMAELFKVVLAMRNRIIPGIPNFTAIGEHISLAGSPFVMADVNRDWAAITDYSGQVLPRRAGINSYSFGGVNAHTVLEEYINPLEKMTSFEQSASPQLVVFSARNRERLLAAVSKLLGFIERQKEIALSDLAYTLQVGREAMESRTAMLVSSREELIVCMREYIRWIREGKEKDNSLPVFSGELEDEKTGIKELLAGQAGEAALKVLLAERDLEKIALYWVSGGSIQWESLHQNDGARRVSLPTYPFEEKEYWIPQAGVPNSAIIENNPISDTQLDLEPKAGLNMHIKKSISELTGIPAEELPAGKPLRSLGFNSMQAVTMRYRLEQDWGVEIPLAAVSDHKTLEQLENDIKAIVGPALKSRVDGDAAGILPEIVPDITGRCRPFPLNDIQESFLAGRKLRFGGDWVGCHIYFEMEILRLDVYRFKKAWDQLVRHHDMLRTAALPEGGQIILDNPPPYIIKVIDLRRKSESERSDYLSGLRDKMSHRLYDPGRWPLFEISVSVCPGERYIVHFSIDEFVTDAGGIYLLLQQWRQLYAGTGPEMSPLRVSFRDYVLALKKFEDTQRYSRDLQYWLKKLENMPAGPALPRPPETGGIIDRVKFFRTRLNGALSQKQWQELKSKADRLNVSATALLLTIFTEFLRLWSGGGAYSLILTYFNRLPLHPQIESVLGPFVSTSIFVVEENSGLDLDGLIRRRQECLWKDLDHSAVSGIRVLRELKSRRKIPGSFYLPVVFTSLLNSSGAESALSESFFRDISFMVTQTPQVCLDHQALEQDGELRFSWDVAEGCFRPGLIRQMFSRYCRVIEMLASPAGQWDREALASRIMDSSHLAGRETTTFPGGGMVRAVEPPAGLQLQCRPADKHRPFPLTDQQQAYVFGRHWAGGHGGCRVYQELEAGRLDAGRLENTWQKLMSAHEMLITVIEPEGGLQRVLEEVPGYRIKVADLSGRPAEEVREELNNIRRAMTERVFVLGEWPYFELRVSVLGSGRSIIHFSIDMLIADARSIELLLGELFHYYHNPSEEPLKPGLLFRDYVMGLKDYKGAVDYQRSVKYWLDKFAEIPPGPLLQANSPHTDGQRHGHKQLKGELESWAALKETAGRLSVPPEMILLAVYAEVIASWQNYAPFSIVIPCWERMTLHPDINRVVGDFTTLCWVVYRGEKISLAEKARLYHRAVLEDLAHQAVSGLTALRKAGLKNSRQGGKAFPVVFTNMLYSSAGDILKGFKKLVMYSKTPQVYLDNISEEHEGQLCFYWDVMSGIYPPGLMEDMFEGYMRILERLGSSPDWENIDFNGLIGAQPEKYGKILM